MRSSFNPRPRAGGDGRIRGAMRHVLCRFQSTPPRGGRRARLPAIDVRCDPCFNPRPRAGGDAGASRCRSQLQLVSIHAPARGATEQSTRCEQSLIMFQSTPPRGGRPTADRILRCVDMQFQSTPPRGGRPTLGPDCAEHRRVVSIHAPARGATAIRLRSRSVTSGFNPRPRAGGDRQRSPATSRADDVSIHAPARGATA